MEQETEKTLAGIGNRLRLVRGKQSMTLSQVADLTGISVSTLSRLERGQRQATLELLLPLARVYGVPLDVLVGGPPIGDPRVHLRQQRRCHQTVISVSRSHSGLHVFKHVMDPVGPVPHEPVLRIHPGHEWLYVLTGELRLVLDHQEYRVRAGQAAQFDTRRGHWFGNALADGVTECLSLFNEAGTAVHLPASSLSPA